tara:strand:- start:73 stop:354 length:282 start_codon:yes stop_codon:yes gene_type:complete
MGGKQTITLSHVEMSIVYHTLLTRLSEMMRKNDKNERRMRKVTELIAIVDSIQHQMESNWSEIEADAALERETEGVRFLSSIPAFGDKTEDLA